jgi:MAF protein
VLGADTVVALDGQPLGKPTDSEDAARMLGLLRGREHQVITAVAAARLDPGQAAPQTWTRANSASVLMRGYTDAEIQAYVASGDPLDKAGSYAIQHPGFHPVERLAGCYLTVVGLGLPETLEVLAAAGHPRPSITLNDLLRACPGCVDTVRLLIPSSNAGEG